MMSAATSFTDSPGWPAIQGSLDVLPVFTLANKEEKPLQYEVNGQPQAVFYADIAAAKKEFEDARDQYEMGACDLIAVGLGTAYKLSCDAKASIVPGRAELTACGMPAEMSPIGQDVPLFACMQMSKEKDGGGSVLPVFMSFEDCEAALTEAREADPFLEITPLSLPSIVEHLSTVANGEEPFEFVAASRSTRHIESYVGNGVYARVVDEEEE